MDKDVVRLAVREAKHHVATQVKNDWEWPRTSPTRDAAEEVADFAGREIPSDQQFRERYYSDGPSSTEGSPVRKPGQPQGLGINEGGSEDLTATQGNKKSQEFIFESPDTVGQTVDRRRVRRIRRRNARLLEEMEWNEGLRNWMVRRDAWTGAVNPMTKSMQDQYDLKAGREQNAPPTPTQPTSATPATEDPAPSSTKPNPDAESPHSSTIVGSDTDDGTEGYETAPASAVDTHFRLRPDPEDDPNLDSAMIPLAPPFLPPTNPVRQAVGPKTYDEIYEKTVVTACAPSVPINLADMTKACVHGWQKDGVWGQAAANQAIGTTTTITAGNPLPNNGGDGRSLLERMMGGSSKKKREAAAARAREMREQRKMELVAAKQRTEADASHGVISGGGMVPVEGEPKGILANHPRVRASVDGVKKVFRLSGGPHSPIEEEGKNNGIP